MCQSCSAHNQNQMDIHIEEDGTITIKTTGFGKQVHASAEEFLEVLTELVGGTKTSTKIKPKLAHVANRVHQHS